MSKLRSIKNEINRFNIFIRHDREMAKILLTKDFYRLLSRIFPPSKKNFEKYMEIYVKRLDTPRTSKIMGVKFFHRLRDFESLRDVFDSRDYSLVKDFIPKSGDFVIDAGAGVGEYTLIASFAVGRNGKVIAFEASSEPFHYLRKNARTNPNRNVTAIRSAVSDRDGKIKIFRPTGTSFVDSVTKNWSGQTTTYSVKSVAIDGFVRRLRMEKLDLLKLDIEGAELLALSGAKMTLSKLRPRVIIETHGESIHKQVLGFLRSHGYEINLENVKFRKPFIALVYASPKSRHD